VIQAVCGDGVVLVDSAEAVLKHLGLVFNYPPPSPSTGGGKIRASSTGVGETRDSSADEGEMRIIGKDYFYVSDNAERFGRIARMILGFSCLSIKKINIGEKSHG